MDALVEILLCEGEDVELGARTSKYVFVFAIDSYCSLSLYLALIHIAHIIYMLGVVWCLTSFEPRELHIVPQLLFRGI